MEYICEFVDSNGVATGEQISLPATTTPKNMNDLVNQILKNEEEMPYTFYVNDEIVIGSLDKLLNKPSTEKVLQIVYRPESLYAIRSVSFCSATLPGHTHIILCIAYSADGLELATGGGDGSVIFWDVSTQNMKQKIEVSPKFWIQCITWYSDCKTVAVAGTEGKVIILKKQEDDTFKVTKSFKVTNFNVTALEWEPMMLNNSPHPRICVATSNGEVAVYCSGTGTRLVAFNGHSPKQLVMGLGWNGQGVIFSSSNDHTLKAFDSNTGAQLDARNDKAGELRSLSISSAYVLRTGGWEFGKLVDEDMKVAAEKRYKNFLRTCPRENVAVGDSMGRIFMYKFANNKFSEPMLLTGHQNLVNHVLFSPNGYWLASAGKDKAVLLFDGKTGKFICRLGKGRGKSSGQHLKDVYRLVWSADSRLLISASEDTTLKVWDVARQKMKNDLPGHEDAVYAVDWSPAGGRAASGGKDKKIKLWGA